MKRGWVDCRVRIKTIVFRCFRCHDYERIANACKDADRRNLYSEFRHDNQKAAGCSQCSKCILCSNRSEETPVDNIPGPAMCISYRQAKRASVKAKK